MGGQAEDKKSQKPTKHICAGLLAHVDAGKTTLAKLLSGFLLPVEGTMEVGGTDRIPRQGSPCRDNILIFFSSLSVSPPHASGIQG